MEYKVIPNHPDYEISEYGDVRRIGSDHILSSRKRGGDPQVCLNGKYEHISRLVASSFFDIPEEETRYLVVMHRDGNPNNNEVSNLCWCTKADQMKNVYKGIRHDFWGCEPKTVRVIETGRIYSSISACAEDLGCTPGGVRQVISGRRNTIKGVHVECI